jgi:hypothetical protein
LVLPVEFTQEAMAEIDDLPRVARLLSRMVDFGRVVCGQADPLLRELVIDEQRVLYRVEREQIVVLSADPAPPSLH